MSTGPGETVPRRACRGRGCRIRPFPTRARVFAGLDLAGARRAADRGIAVGDERMRGPILRREIGGDVLPRPVRERIDLEPPHVVGGVDFETWPAGPFLRLDALAPGDGLVEPGQPAPPPAHLAARPHCRGKSGRGYGWGKVGKLGK